jgi:hypothetical protein
MEPESVYVICCLVDGFDFHVVIINESEATKISENREFDITKEVCDLEPIEAYTRTIMTYPLKDGFVVEEGEFSTKLFVKSEVYTEEDRREEGTRILKSFDETFSLCCIQGERFECPTIIESREDIISRFLHKKEKRRADTTIIKFDTEDDIGIIKTENTYLVFEENASLILIHTHPENGVENVKYIVMTPRTDCNLILSLLIQQSGYYPIMMNFMNMLKEHCRIEIDL